MRCAEIRDLLHPFLDGELEVDRNVDLLKHLELCEACRVRCDQERRLRTIVSDSAAEPLGETARRRILDRAYAQASEEPVRRLPRALLAAAALLVAGALTWLGVADPLCLRGCPTARAVHLAFDAVEEVDPLDLSELGVPLDAPTCVGMECEGANLVATPGGAKRPALRYHCCNTGRELTFVRIPAGHTHFWQRRTHTDGRKYAEAAMDGVRMVAWEDTEGKNLSACIVDAEVPSEALYVMASALRDSGV